MSTKAKLTGKQLNLAKVALTALGDDFETCALRVVDAAIKDKCYEVDQETLRAYFVGQPGCWTESTAKKLASETALIAFHAQFGRAHVVHVFREAARLFAKGEPHRLSPSKRDNAFGVARKLRAECFYNDEGKKVSRSGWADMTPAKYTATEVTNLVTEIGAEKKARVGERNKPEAKKARADAALASHLEAAVGFLTDKRRCKWTKDEQKGVDAVLAKMGEFINATKAD